MPAHLSRAAPSWGRPRSVHNPSDSLLPPERTLAETFRQGRGAPPALLPPLRRKGICPSRSFLPTHPEHAAQCRHCLPRIPHPREVPSPGCSVLSPAGPVSVRRRRDKTSSVGTAPPWHSFPQLPFPAQRSPAYTFPLTRSPSAQLQDAH